MAAASVALAVALFYSISVCCGEAADPAPEGVTSADPEKQDSSALDWRMQLFNKPLPLCSSVKHSTVSDYTTFWRATKKPQLVSKNPLLQPTSFR